MFWPESQASEMVTHLAQHAGMPVEPAASTNDPAAYAQAMGLEAEPVTLKGGEVATTLSPLAPGFIRILGQGYLAVTAVSRKRVNVLTPALRIDSIPFD